MELKEKLESVLPTILHQYIDFLVASAEKWTLTPELLGAILMRESGGGVYLTPKGPTGKGDYTNGVWHGFGLAQLDIRSHQDILNLQDDNGIPLWQDPAWNIDHGAEILSNAIGKLADLGLDAGVAAYNAGTGHIRKIVEGGEDCDTGTTGKDYAASVLAQATGWHDQIKDPDCSCIICDRDQDVSSM